MRVRYSFSSRKTGTIEPGNDHTKAIPQVVRENVRISDIVIEVLDARHIDETRHSEFEALVGEMGKKLMFVVNKVDLVKDVAALRHELAEKGVEPHV
jgi:ribosome biogenesis GTPase A